MIIYSRCQLYSIVQPGASLIELIIVIALCLFALQLTFGLGTFFSQIMTRVALDELYTQCRYAHMKALVLAKEEKIVFDDNHRGYYWNTIHTLLPDNVYLGTVPGAQGPPFSPTHPIIHPVTFKDATITFKENGIIGSGSVYITDTTRTYGYALTVAVAPYAYVRCYRYNGTWCHIT